MRYIETKDRDLHGRPVDGPFSRGPQNVPHFSQNGGFAGSCTTTLDSFWGAITGGNPHSLCIVDVRLMVEG